MKASTAFVCLFFWTVTAFPVLQLSHRIPTHLALTSADLPPVVLPSQQSLFQQQQQQLESPLSQGIWNYLSTSTTTLALQERKVPTAEEVQQKKTTFNLIFWGGGFVAPFLATIFYFGFRFWEK